MGEVAPPPPPSAPPFPPPPTPPPPHAIMFPYPAQGHINPMMQLAQRLLSEGFFVTFVNTEINQSRMATAAAAAAAAANPRLRFEQIPDGLPQGHGRFNENVQEVTAAILALPGELARLVRRIAAANDGRPPATCIIADAFCSWVQEVADQFAIPRVALWTTPAHASLAYHFQSLLIDNGYVPISAADLRRRGAEIVSCIDGIAPLKLQDFISFFLIESSTDFLFQWHLRLCMRRPLEAAWNLGNNLAALEAAAVGAFKAEVPNFLPIGPLLHLSRRSNDVNSLCSLLPESAATCLRWLDAQPPSSVLYISFGSFAHLPAEVLASLIAGVSQSGAPFLWALRPDQSGGAAAFDGIRDEIAAGRLDGLIVPWAPQLEVLNHASVGAFFSHCGWNSLVESFCAGVPVLAFPGGFAEQCMNAHYVSEVWRFGVRLPAKPTAAEVSDSVRRLLEPTLSSDFRKRLADFKAAAAEAHEAPSGSSYKSFRLFADDMTKRAASAAAASAAAAGRAGGKGD